MHIQRNVSQKRLCLVVLLTGFLLFASGCGGPQSSPKTSVRAYLEAINSRQCNSLATLILGWEKLGRYGEELMADCKCSEDAEINLDHLKIEEMFRNEASSAQKLNGFGDSVGVEVQYAWRNRGCSDCGWTDMQCTLGLQQHKGKWWIAPGPTSRSWSCVPMPCPQGPAGGRQR